MPLLAKSTIKKSPDSNESGLREGGGDLLSHFRSTIGVVRFNFSVRNGKRWNPHAITTLISLSLEVFDYLLTYKVKKNIGSNFLSFPSQNAVYTETASLCLVCSTFVVFSVELAL